MRVLYALLALLFFILGVIGAFLPGLPTTPFLLLMSYFLLKVSPALHARVLEWPLVGEPIRQWHEEGGVDPKVKWVAFTMVTLLVGVTVCFGSLGPLGNTIVVLAAIVGLTVVACLPTIGQDSIGQDSNDQDLDDDDSDDDGTRQA